MAQKNNVAAKSPAKTNPKARPAPPAKPASRTEVKAATKQPVKSKGTPATLKAKPAKSPELKSTASKVSPVKAAKSVSKPAPSKTASSNTATAKTTSSKTTSSKAASSKAASSKTSPSKPAPSKPAPKAAERKPAPAVAQTKPTEPVKVAAVKAAPVDKPLPEIEPAAAKPASPQPQRVPPPVAKPAPAIATAAIRTGPVQFGTAAARTVPSALPKPAVRTFPAPGVSTGPAMPRDLAHKAADARQQQLASAVAGAAAAGAKKPVTSRHGFKINESIVYPAHGVGRIIGIEEQEIAGMPLELFVIQFEKDKMTLKVPTGKLQTVGMRKLAEDDIVTKAMETLKGRARVKRTMWSRRAQEYEAKINSGDLVSIAEVVRDLYRSESQPEQSYSERQLYEAALDRMAREIAAVARIDERGAVQRITEVLSKSAKGRRAAEATEAPEGGDTDSEADAKAA